MSENRSGTSLLIKMYNVRIRIEKKMTTGMNIIQSGTSGGYGTAFPVMYPKMY